jgi:Flp pilus assembly protein TadB
MLSSDDRRKLETIERQLSRDDPALARALRADPGRTPRRRPATGAIVAACVLAALVAMVLLGPAIVVVGVLLVLCGTGLRAARRRGNPGTRAQEGG